jgi:plasmid stabilization system protein ParE
MPSYRVVPELEQDIEDALVFTARRYGIGKYLEYAALIEEALEELDADPRAGRPRPYIHEQAWVYRIAKPGRKARHVFLYRIAEGGYAVIYGLFYDGMNLPNAWKGRKDP